MAQSFCFSLYIQPKGNKLYIKVNYIELRDESLEQKKQFKFMSSALLNQSHITAKKKKMLSSDVLARRKCLEGILNHPSFKYRMMPEFRGSARSLFLRRPRIEGVIRFNAPVSIVLEPARHYCGAVGYYS